GGGEHRRKHGSPAATGPAAAGSSCAVPLPHHVLSIAEALRAASQRAGRPPSTAGAYAEGAAGLWPGAAGPWPAAPVQPSAAAGAARAVGRSSRPFRAPLRPHTYLLVRSLNCST